MTRLYDSRIADLLLADYERLGPATPAGELELREWLHRHGIPYSQLIFVDKYARHADDDHESLSLDELKALPFCIAVEDSPEMATFLTNEMAVRTVLFARPWNAMQHASGAVPSSVGRYVSWHEIHKHNPKPTGDNDTP